MAPSRHPIPVIVGTFEIVGALEDGNYRDYRGYIKVI